ncbi:unnamed protein product, partial [Lymnaea stagnalis]
MSERTDDQEAMLAAFQKESENSQDSLADIQVKDEPEDSSYEQKQSPEISSCPDSRNSSPLPPIHFENSSPFHTNVSSPVPTLLSKGNTAAQIPLNDIFAGSTIRSQLQGAIDGKKMDTVQNIVEGLLKKNETLLAMSDAGLLKPNPRRVRAAYDSHARKSTQTRVNIFPISSTLQARMNPSKKISESFRPHIIRPKSPTLRSNSILKDKTQFTYALLESKICDDEIEKIFKVQNHEIVCGISSQSYLADECDKIVASLDLDYFWCNFCPFATSNKPLLIQHALEHRFKCKFCAYESFCRSDIVRHMHKLHSDFSEVAGRLSYCALLSDYLRVKARAEGKENKDPDENVDDLDPQEMNKAIQELEGRKRKAESSSHGISSSPKAARLDSDDVESSSDLSRKSRKSQNPKRCPPPKDSDYDMFEMEVEEISESPQDAGHEESDSDRVLYSSSHSSPNPYFHTQDGHPFPTGMMQVIPGMQSQSGSMQTSAPRTKPGQTNTGCRGRGRGIRGPRYASSSSLYWSCGYCTFQSNSQAEIKEHSNRAHPGKPHRYVALIKNLTPDSVINKSPRSTSTLNPIGKQSTLSTSSGDSLHRSHSPLVQMSPSASLPRSPQVSTESHATNGEEDIEDTEEVVSLKETSSLLKVRINPVRSTRKENIVYRCYHCTYTAKRHSAMKSHIYYKHRGKGLVAVDDESQPKQHIFFCARDDCTFKSERADSYLHHVDQCTPWNKPELADVEVEPHIRECLEQTVLLAE